MKDNIQSFLNFFFQLYDIKSCFLSDEPALYLLADFVTFDCPSERSFRTVVFFVSMGILAFFCKDFHRRIKIIHEQIPLVIKILQRNPAGFAFVAVIAHKMPHVAVVLLLDEAVVVFLVGAASCEGNSVVSAPPDHLVVLELAAVVGIKPFKRIRKRRSQILRAFLYPAVRLVQKRVQNSPSEADIGKGQRETVFTGRFSAFRL